MQHKNVTQAFTRPLVVSYGAGVDSTAVLVGLYNRGIRPDLIMFANVGGEKDQTYAYIPMMNAWLTKIGFPTITEVKYQAKNFKHWPPYRSLEENCLTNGTLPSIAFGFGSCSQKWKASPQDKFLKAWEPAIQAWRAGGRVTKVIGYDCSGRDSQRRTYADKATKGEEKYAYWYPLQDWGWDRDECMRQISQAGLAVPFKSSCFFCTAMQPAEVDALPQDKLRRLVLLEARAKPRLKSTEGLWRSSTKRRPGSMTEYIRQRGLLPENEIVAIQQVPAELVQHQADYAAGKSTLELGQFLEQRFPTLYQIQTAPAAQKAQVA